MAPKATPYIHHNGEIIIPFNSDPKYHFWNGGQHICETMTELNAPQDVWDKHTLKPFPVSEV